jgi:hypothetical protein
MRRRQEGTSGSQAEQQDMERMSGTGQTSSSTGSTTGASSSGVQDTGGTTYQQQGYPPQQGGYQQGGAQTASHSQGAPARREDHGGGADYGRSLPSRHGSALAIIAGTLAFLEGLAFAIRSSHYPSQVGYLYRWHLHDWGIVLMVLGALLIGAGVSHLLGIPRSRHVAAGLAVLTAVVAFLTIFYSIIWGIAVLAASGFAAYSLLSSRDREFPAGNGPGAYEGQTYGGQTYGGQGGTRQETVSSSGRGGSRPI